MKLEIYKTDTLEGHLLDGVERNAEFPESFGIPSEEQKAAVAVGDNVKIAIEIDVEDSQELGGERFWVRIVATAGEGSAKVFFAEVLDVLMVIDAGPGDIIKFRAEHIIDLDEDREVQQ